MKLFKVSAYPRQFSSPEVSKGFSSRPAAEQFATALAGAGKCLSADIEPYHDDDEDDDDK